MMSSFININSIKVYNTGLEVKIKEITLSLDLSEKAVEKEIQDKGLTAPRLTPEYIDSIIVEVDYHVFDNSCLMVCCMTLLNGFTVSGESACASPENFDADIGQKIAFANARDKIWMLEGYLLKDNLHQKVIADIDNAFG